MKPAPQLYLLDGSSYIYRAYFGIRDRATAAGMPTNAIYGFTRMLLDLLRENQPDYLAVVFDRPREETFRRQIYPDYKKNRDAVPEDLSLQIPYIKQIVTALNIAALDAPGFEADDIIATLAKKSATAGIDVTVVTGDKDLMQIVDERITLFDTMKDRRSGPPQVIERFGVAANLVPDILGLAGDTSDNIPGVPGIGEKTAAELIQQFDSLEGVLKWRSLINGKKRRENLTKYAEQARLSKQLATLRYDVPLEVSLSDLQSQSPHLTELLPLLRQLEFSGLEILFTPPEAGVVEIYSDGSGRDSGPGGYGVVLRYGSHEKELSGFEPVATSQRMELIAAIKGLEALKNRSSVRIFSDSQYLVRGMNEWLQGWIRKGRLTEPGELKNQDLWQQLAALNKQHEISWHWVRGHAGQPFNERCDKLAKRAVEEGLRPQNVAAAKPLTEVETPPEASLPSTPPPKPVPIQAWEDAQYEAEDDGQFRLC